MRKPEEPLDDFNVKAAPEPADPPIPVELYLTGEVEVLKPLKGDLERPDRVRSGLSWFHRSLALGGAVGVFAIVLLSAIFIAITDPPTETGAGPMEIAQNSDDEPIEREPDAGIPQTEDSTTFDTISSHGFDKPAGTVRSVARPTRARTRARFASHRQRRHVRRLQLTKFVPTTLIIYPEDGAIKHRIEPQLSAAYRKPVTFQ